MSPVATRELGIRITDRAIADRRLILIGNLSADILGLIQIKA